MQSLPLVTMQAQKLSIYLFMLMSRLVGDWCKILLKAIWNCPLIGALRMAYLTELAGHVQCPNHMRAITAISMMMHMAIKMAG